MYVVGITVNITSFSIYEINDQIYPHHHNNMYVCL